MTRHEIDGHEDDRHEIGGHNYIDWKETTLQWLQRLQLTTLKSRRVRAGLSKMFIIMNDLEDINYRDFVVSNIGPGAEGTWNEII